MKDLKFALVTGASEGIGKAIAEMVLREGFRVVLSSRNEEKLKMALDSFEALSQNAVSMPADLTVSAEVKQLVEIISREEGKIDLLVNNLGRGLQRQVINTTDEEWDYMVKANLSSAFYLSRAVLPIMREQGNGMIINIASRAGRRGEGDFAAYSALKHGLVGLTRALADSEGKYGIRVNAVCPGPVSTERMQRLHPTANHQDWLAPEDVSDAVRFLVSPAAKTMNGQVIDMFDK